MGVLELSDSRGNLYKRRSPWGFWTHVTGGLVGHSSHLLFIQYPSKTSLLQKHKPFVIVITLLFSSWEFSRKLGPTLTWIPEERQASPLMFWNVRKSFRECLWGMFIICTVVGYFVYCRSINTKGLLRGQRSSLVKWSDTLLKMCRLFPSPSLFFPFLLLFFLCFCIGCVVLCLVAQSCPTLCLPMDCSPPGSSAPGDSPGKNTGVACHSLLQEIFPTQKSNPSFPPAFHRE